VVVWEGAILAPIWPSIAAAQARTIPMLRRAGSWRPHGLAPPVAKPDDGLGGSSASGRLQLVQDRRHGLGRRPCNLAMLRRGRRPPHALRRAGPVLEGLFVTLLRRATGSYGSGWPFDVHVGAGGADTSPCGTGEMRIVVIFRESPHSSQGRTLSGATAGSPALTRHPQRQVVGALNSDGH
jgi:hypothetical protein